MGAVMNYKIGLDRRAIPLAVGAALVALLLVNPGRWWEVAGAVALLVVLARQRARPTEPEAPPGQHRLSGEAAAESVEGDLPAIGVCLTQTLIGSANDVGEELGQIRSLVADAVRTLEGAFDQLHTDTTEQRNLIDGIVSALVDGVSVDDNESNLTIGAFAQKTADLLTRFVQRSELSNEHSLDLVNRMDDMSLRMDEMMGLLDDITKIAGQTKLLSLNATIEAARAGEAGRGFAVVAGEVRELSENSNRFSEQIQKRLEDMRASMQQTRDAVHGTASSGSDALLEGKAELGSMTTQIHELNHELSRQASQASQLTDRLGRGTADAVRSLQFEDIVRQVTEHAESRVSRMVEFVEDLPVHLRSNDAESLAAARVAIATSAAHLVASAPAPPANQQSLDTGSIDLF